MEALDTIELNFIALEFYEKLSKWIANDTFTFR